MKLSKRISSSTKPASSKKNRRKPVSTAPTDLVSWQRLMHAAITRPLAAGDLIQPEWTDGRPIGELVDPLVKGSASLPAVERLQIYNRMYWYRLLECVADDFPGLKAFLGADRFWKLAEAYLDKYPSQSYTLRNLCSRLPQFVEEDSSWTAPDTRASVDIARFEWAQIVAFDGAEWPPFSPQRVAAADPESLQISLQPYLTLLHLEYSADEYAIAVKRADNALRTEASQAITKRKKLKPVAAAHAKLLIEEPIEVVVHRVEGQLYYKRIEPAAAALLRALAAGAPLAAACERAMQKSPLAPTEQAALIQRWFALWMRLGWLCPRQKNRPKSEFL